MRIFTQVLDGTHGTSAAGVAVRLARADRYNWSTVADAKTDDKGCVEHWNGWQFERGIYRLVFDSDSYFARLGLIAAYPEVAVSFRIESESHAFQVQVTLAPHAYSTYFGAVDGPSAN